MRTLLVTLEYPPFKGGVANYYYNLAGHFPHEEAFFVVDNNEKKLDGGRGFFSWFRAFAEIYRKIKFSRIDYVLVGHILPLGTVVCLLSFLKVFKYGVFLHGLDFSSALKSGRKKKLAELILKKADKIIAANSYVAAQVGNVFPFAINKISVINPGLPSNPVYVPENELEELRVKYDLRDKFILLSVGRLVRRKGFDNVIKALSLMSDDDLSNIRYVLIGKGSDHDYLKSLVTPNLKDKIIFFGEAGETDKWRWLHLCDAFIMPTRNISGDYEGFGIVYLEANLCAKPVIAGDAGGVRDAVVDNLNGLLLNSDNPEEIKEAILKLKNDKNLRDTLGRQGYERVVNDFNWEKLAVKLLKAIK